MMDGNSFKVPGVPDRLEAAANLFRERNLQYGNNYVTFGPILEQIFPDGFKAKGAAELNRMLIFAHLFTKLTRYAQNMNKGGHADSLEDICVYSQMLAEMDEQYREKELAEFMPQAVHTVEQNADPTFLEEGDEWLRNPATGPAVDASTRSGPPTPRHPMAFSNVRMK